MMKNVIISVMFLVVSILFTAGIASAETVTVVATMQADVKGVMSIEFYNGANILYPYGATIPFTNIDPTQSMCYSDGRTLDNGKSDTGVKCQSNTGETWYLKMGVTSTGSPAFPLDHFKFYMGQPWCKGVLADGTLTYPEGQWYLVPQSSSTVYKAGRIDTNNYGDGTIATLSFAVNPEGLSGGANYSMKITYTMTTS